MFCIIFWCIRLLWLIWYSEITYSEAQTESNKHPNTATVSEASLSQCRWHYPVEEVILYQQLQIQYSTWTDGKLVYCHWTSIEAACFWAYLMCLSRKVGVVCDVPQDWVEIRSAGTQREVFSITVSAEGNINEVRRTGLSAPTQNHRR